MSPHDHSNDTVAREMKYNFFWSQNPLQEEESLFSKANKDGNKRGRDHPLLSASCFYC